MFGEKFEKQQCDVILRTKKYDMFVAHEKNRIQFNEEPTNKEYIALKKSVKEEGCNKDAIVVNQLPNGKFLVIKGHHRFLACKHTNSVLRYVVDNEYTLEKAIQFDMTTTKDWDRVELYKKGIKEEIPLCLFINELSEDYSDKISETYVRKLVLRYLSRRENFGNKYISEDNFYAKLLRGEMGIVELKQIKVDKEDKERAREMIEGFINFYGCNSNIGMHILQNFTAFWGVIKDNYDIVFKNWKKINSKMRNGEANPSMIIIYNKLYQSPMNTYKEGVDELIKRRFR